MAEQFTDESKADAIAVQVSLTVAGVFEEALHEISGLTQAQIEVVGVSDLPAADLQRCLQLLDANLGKYYRERQGLKWMVDKAEEMQEPGLVYLLVKQGSELSAFVSFLCCVEDEQLVIYLYEIQLQASLRNLGLGTKIIQTLGGKVIPILNDHFRCKFEGLMLTCFNDNDGALRFYRRQGFSLAAHSPVDKTLRSGKVIQPEYYILFKPAYTQ